MEGKDLANLILGTTLGALIADGAGFAGGKLVHTGRTTVKHAARHVTGRKR